MNPFDPDPQESLPHAVRPLTVGAQALACLLVLLLALFTLSSSIVQDLRPSTPAGALSAGKSVQGLLAAARDSGRLAISADRRDGAAGGWPPLDAGIDRVPPQLLLFAARAATLAGAVRGVVTASPSHNYRAQGPPPASV